MPSAKLERWPACGLELMVSGAGGDRGDGLATGCSDASFLPGAAGSVWSTMAAAVWRGRFGRYVEGEEP